jgi:hypothetical protein
MEIIFQLIFEWYEICIIEWVSLIQNDWMSGAKNVLDFIF